MRCLAELGSKCDGLKELKRTARHSNGRSHPPRNFSMETSKGYWRRYVLPKIDLETGRVEYIGSLPNVVASFGASDADSKSQGDQVAVHNQKAKGGNGKYRGHHHSRRTRRRATKPNWQTIAETERSSSMAHAPGSGKRFPGGRNIHGGCGKGGKCERNRDMMSAKNLHWAIAAELIRRGGRRIRPSRIAPENVDGMVGL